MTILDELFALIDRNDLDGAEALMQRAGLATSTASQALYLQGLIAYGRGDRRLAKVKFSRSAKAAPGFAAPLIALGNACLALREADAALKAYHSALALEPDNVAILGNIGAAENVLGQFEAAEATLKRALELVPGNPAALGNLAEAQRRRGDFAAALATVAAMGDDPSAAELRTAIERQQAEAAPPTA
jgi:cytochrome c-type biogenesis protein CcmH/NrfG